MAKTSFKKCLCTFLSALIFVTVFIVTPNTANDVQAAMTVPTGVKLMIYSDTVAKIGWSKVSGVTGYIIYRSTDGKTFSKIKTVSSSTVAYTDSGLSSGKTYYYSVASYKTANSKTTTSAKSSTVKVTTTTSSKCPIPTNFKVSSYSSDCIYLTWKAVPNASGYRIYRSTDGKNYSPYKSVSTTTYSDTGLASAKTYYYKIASYKTINGVNAVGPQSSAVKAKTTSVPVTITKATTSSTSIRIYWKTRSSALGYQIYRYNSETNKYDKVYAASASATSWADTNLKSNKTYTYRMRAYYRSNGVAYYSPYSSISAKTAPAPLTGVKATTVSYSSIKVSWNAASGASGYQVYKLAPGESSYTLVYTASASELSHIVTMLKASTTYSFKVRAIYKTSASQTYGGFGTVAKATTLSSNQESIIADQIYNRINSIRSQNSVRLLARNEDVDRVAELRAEEISRKFSSTRPDGRSWVTAISDANLSYRFIGENIAYGYSSADGVVQMWMQRDVEKKNILDASFNQVGIGVYYSNGVPYYCVTFYRPV